MWLRAKKLWKDVIDVLMMLFVIFVMLFSEIWSICQNPRKFLGR